MRLSIISWVLAVLAVVADASVAFAEDWPQFRGPNATGATTEGNPPAEWSEEKNVAWIAELPGAGFSQPVVVGDNVYVTGDSGYRRDNLHVLCYDAKTGKQRWHRQFWATGRTVVPDDMRVATPTPLATPDRIYAFFSSNDLACLDNAGNLLWYRGLSYDNPNASNSLGMASSPVLAEGTLVCQLETDDASFAVGIAAETGENRWKIDRPRKANWTSPTLLESESGPQVLLEAADGVTAVSPETGETLWKFEGGGSTISSVTVADGILYVPSGGVIAVRPPVGSASPETLWKSPKLNCHYVSPVVYNDRVYTINHTAVLNCADAKTGDTLWQLRIGGGEYWGTPSAAGGKLYCPSREGIVKVVDISGEKGELIAENAVGESLNCPPAIVGDAIYLRTDTKLWKVASP